MLAEIAVGGLELALGAFQVVPLLSQLYTLADLLCETAEKIMAECDALPNLKGNIYD